MSPERRTGLALLLLALFALPGFTGWSSAQQHPRPKPAAASSKGTPPRQSRKTPGKQAKAGKSGAPVGQSAASLQEADRITAEADRRAEHEVEREQGLREHFRLCDLDANGWISFRESVATLGIDREEFLRYDAQRDGRIDLAEFQARSRELLTLLGALELPTPRRQAGEFAGAPAADLSPSIAGGHGSSLAELFPKPADLVQRYDKDQSAGLDQHELETLFTELGLPLAPDLVAAQMDPDHSGQLEASELFGIAWLASERVPRPRDPGLPRPPDGSRPPRARGGPSTHFERLDPSQDGVIDATDLRALLTPARIDVRLNAVLSAIDENGDGRLTEEEFLDSLRDRPRNP